MKAVFKAVGYCLSCFVFLVCCGCQTPAAFGKKPLPPRDSDLLGFWDGLTQDGLYFFRIKLEPDGTGLCAYVYLREEPRLLAVQKWSNQSGRINLALSPIDDDRNQIREINGVAHATIMNLTVLGNGWRSPLVLRPEDDIQRRFGLVKSRMENYKVPPQPR